MVPSGLAAARARLRPGQLFEDEAKFRRTADGRYRWFSGARSSTSGPAWKNCQMVRDLRDIEDRKRAEDHPRDARIRLTRAWQIATVAEPSASIARELNRSTSLSYLYLLTLKLARTGWRPIREICWKLTH